MVVLLASLVLFALNASRAAESLFYRVRGPVANRITALDRHGCLTWTNVATNATFTIQVASKVLGGTNWADNVQVPTTSLSTRYRVFAPSGSNSMNIALVPKNLGNPYFDEANNGAQSAAKELGINVLYQGSTNADATEQIQLLNSLIAQRVDGLALSANDAQALIPTGQNAMSQGIPVVTWDSPIEPQGRNIHINQATAQGIAHVQIEIASRLAGGQGQIAILSTTPTAPNQNEWIGLMNNLLTETNYQQLTLVATVFGNDEDAQSYHEAIGLMTNYPSLKVILAPTVVGSAAAARAVQDQGKSGTVFVTGLGTPNQMRPYVKNGIAPEFALWNPVDYGYLTIYTTYHLVKGNIMGKPGDEFTAGKLGQYAILGDGTILLGPPMIFNASNIDDFNF